MKTVWKVHFVAALCILKVASLSAQQKRAIVPSDCVTVKSLLIGNASVRNPIQMNPQGTQVAYLVKTPNLSSNTLDIALYVKNLTSDKTSGSPHLLLEGDVSELQWLGDGRHLTVLFKKGGVISIERVDATTAIHSTLVRAGEDIREYSVDNAGDTVVYATDVVERKTTTEHSAQEIAAGYLVPFEMPVVYGMRQRNLFAVRLVHSQWTKPVPLWIESPFTHQRLDSLYYQESFYLRLSPDGKQVLIRYFDHAETLPEAWRDSPFIKRSRSVSSQGTLVLALYQISNGKTRIPFTTPWTSSAPLWSRDSHSFMVVAKPPVGSALEQDDARTHRLEHAHLSDLFWVDTRTDKVVEAIPASYAFVSFIPPLSWNDKNEFLLLTAKNELTWFSFDGAQWKPESKIEIPISTVTRQIASDGRHVVGEFNDAATPPELFVYRPGQQKISTFAKLNPQFDQLTVAHTDEIHWKTSTGYNVTGLLIIPPNYSKETKYPLVIQTKPFGNYFACSNGDFPSFAPQPIANAGIMYLGTIPTEGSDQREEDYHPTQYPGPKGTGGIAEAAFQMDIYDSAVRALADRGLVDRDRVGIIGFSRSGWYTEFTLANSLIAYRAATVADNVKYSVGEFWLQHEYGRTGHETMYGGPPFGSTLKNWLDYSISFNMDKIHTPLLLEDMGFGIPFDNHQLLPIGVAESFEIITGLHSLHKPFEYYYYPDEEHEPQHPKAQLATWQRNVDWYRFWLQGFERPNPEDPDQYKRWEHLRDLQETEDKATVGQPPTKTITPN